MPDTIITEQNLRRLIDTLLAGGVRVVGPRVTGGMTLYEPLGAGEELHLGELPRRSAKETFFPLCEDILRYGRVDGKAQLSDMDLDRLPETVLVAAPPCDAAAPSILDSIFSWDYHDEFFLERRRKTTIIGMACTRADDACFCTAVGHAPDERKGSDLFLTPVEGGGFTVEVLSGKGEAIVARHRELFPEGSAATPLPLAEPSMEPLDLEKLKGWLDVNFDDDLWRSLAAACVGCGVCAFLCPACHCFDISDEGSEAQGCRRKHWDACGFGRFTLHASGHNPRDLQPQRYRNRIMHKFSYYVDKFGSTLCTGCGRCIRSCPVGIDIASIIAGIVRR